MPAIRAAIFDIGGVLTLSPVLRVRRFCESAGLEHRVIGAMLDDPAGAWAQFETSRLDAPGFVAAFERDCATRGLRVDGAALLHAIRGSVHEPREEMIAVVRHLRGRVGLGCITNNFAPAPGRSATPGLDLPALFDVVLESSKLGIRKPDPRIYWSACDQLGVEPREAVFLDDLGSNLKGARALGITTIRVALDETESAIAALEQVLGLALPRA